MDMKTAPTLRFDIYMAGDLDDARRVCREFCFERGECVHLEPAEFIYTGGAESGFKVGFINYARFPREAAELRERAEDLARRLMERLCQHSFSIVGPSETTWFSRRPA